MINFENLFENKDAFREKYLLAKPFPFLIIDNFCDEEKINKLYSSIPELENKSRDFMFANNKFEKSNYKVLGPELDELHSDLHSENMNRFLSYIANEEVFVDPVNHGGGLHQGKKNSYLDMHLDFNYHPIQKNWFRNMNLLLYLNKDWKKEYGGQLKLKDLRTNKESELDVPFNRMIIQQTRGYTLHGYDMTSFPEGRYRTSIATYAYTKHEMLIENPRTTDWVPNKDSGTLKKLIAPHMKNLVAIKGKFFGSGTAKNE